MFPIITETFVDTISLPSPYMEKLKEVLAKVLPVVKDCAKEVVLFGSAARGELKCESDLDILVIIFDEYKPIRREISLSVEMLDVREDVGPTPVDVFVRSDSYMSSQDMFPRNVRKDKKVLWRQGSNSEQTLG